MNVTIRNVPDEVYRRLKQLATEQGSSLNVQLVNILTREAAELKHRRQMRASRKQLDTFVLSLPNLTDSAKLIRKDRDR